MLLKKNINVCFSSIFHAIINFLWFCLLVGMVVGVGVGVGGGGGREILDLIR